MAGSDVEHLRGLNVPRPSKAETRRQGSEKGHRAKEAMEAMEAYRARLLEDESRQP